MKRSLIAIVLAVIIAGVVPASAATLSTAANTVIPAETQQIINVDYRKMNDAPSAIALKQRVLPDALKQFEQALKGVNIDPATDVETLTFAAFKVKSQGLRVVGIAQGNFSRAKVLRKLKTKKVKG